MLAPFNFRDGRCSERWEPGALRALRAARESHRSEGHTNPELAGVKKSPSLIFGINSKVSQSRKPL